MTENHAKNEVLRFDEHALTVRSFNASRIEVFYGQRAVYKSSLQNDHPDALREKTKKDEDRDLAGGGMIGLQAFEGPLKISWNSKDGARHDVVLRLEEIFVDRIVLHHEDSARIDWTFPMQSYGPTIVVEVNDRTLNIYMHVHIYLRPIELTARAREDRSSRLLAYSKTF
jgi:hypothetical protein